MQLLYVRFHFRRIFVQAARSYPTRSYGVDAHGRPLKRRRLREIQHCCTRGAAVTHTGHSIPHVGDDIDDAYALGYLLTLQDRYEILGITTCYGRTDDRAILANKFLAVTGETRIPVYVGKNTSNSSERANWYADQFYWAKGFPSVKKSISATEFIRSQLKKYPASPRKTRSPRY